VCSTGRVHQTKVTRFKEEHRERREDKQRKNEENEEINYMKEATCMVYCVFDK
jgi:hypothetical protein